MGSCRAAGWIRRGLLSRDRGRRRGGLLERAAGHSCGPYRVPNVDVEARTVYTNNPPCGAMRGFGANQAAFAIEGALDRLAEKVGLDGYDIRDYSPLGLPTLGKRHLLASTSLADAAAGSHGRLGSRHWPRRPRLAPPGPRSSTAGP